MGRLVNAPAGPQLDPAGMITEWLAGYPSISIIDGDKQVAATPLAARNTIATPPIAPVPVEVGVEICLDHRLKRLRRTVGMTVQTGAAADNPPLALQLIPSGGMQILDYSVTAGANGVTFNSDGCDPILDVYTSQGKPIIDGSGVFKRVTCGVYASSAQTMVQEARNRSTTVTASLASVLAVNYRVTTMPWARSTPTGRRSRAMTSIRRIPPSMATRQPCGCRWAPPTSSNRTLCSPRFGELHIYTKP